MDSKKILLILLIAIVIIVLFSFTLFFVKKIAKENESMLNPVSTEIKNNDVVPGNETKEEKNATSLVPPQGGMGPVVSSGQVLSIAGDEVKIKGETGDLSLKFSPDTKFYLINPPTPPVLKDKSIVKEGATVWVEYDKGTSVLNSVSAQ